MIVREGLRSKHVLDALKRSAIYPNTLSEVCKSWHRLITGTPALWSYIDLVVSGSHKKMVYPRASLFVERATSTPLFIRIHEPCPASPDDNQQLVRWLSPVAGQLYSLDFSNAHRTTRVAHSVLGCWLKHGAPGTFKEITVWDITRTPTASPFIEPNLGGAPAEWKLDVSAQRLEEFFEPITRLHLRYVFPHWDSRAYSGLTHLNLWGDSITEVQLRRILCNSPPLETLYLALQVTDTEPRTASCVPVHLPCLEALSLNALGASQVSSILRLIAPGPRPLKPAFLLAGNRQDGDFTEMSEIRAFSRRSIITTLYLGSPSNNNNIQSGWLFRTLKIFPHLRRLGLEYYRYLGELPLPEPEGNEVSSECPELRESCMFGCALDLDGFKRLIRTHFVQVLRTCRCRVFSGATELDLPEGELQGALSGSVLDVKCYESNENDCPDPYLNWDFVDGL
ncbi:hypothetical protein FRC08_000449 [Ceratobasidium sp. 394]|nr:hypothetical protein FRC08_000449 [Ceratobasidium sp. 394]